MVRYSVDFQTFLGTSLPNHVLKVANKTIIISCLEKLDVLHCERAGDKDPPLEEQSDEMSRTDYEWPHTGKWSKIRKNNHKKIKKAFQRYLRYTYITEAIKKVKAIF